MLVRPGRLDPAEGDRAILAGRASGRGGGRLGRGPQAGFGEIGGMGEAGGVADDDADAGAPVAPGAQLLDSTVVESGRRGPPVLDEDLREVTAGAQCRAENALNYGGIEHRTPFHASRTSFRRPTATAYRNSMPPQPGLAAEIVAAVTESDTAVALGSGDVPVLGTPRVVALCEEATVKALERCSIRARHRSACASSSTMWPPPRSATRSGPKQRSNGSKAAASRSRCRCGDERGLVAVGKVTRVLVDVERFLEKCR